jgi:O-antigen biosynthesis protein
MILWPFAVGARELRCARQIKPAEHQPHRYTAIGVEPSLKLKRRLPAGWYMLEVLMDLPAFACTGRLHVDTDAAGSNTVSYPLPVRSGRMAKRLIHLPAAAGVRFGPCQREGAITIRHFRLVRVSRLVAHSFMRKKLNRPEIHPAPIELSEAALWKTYNRLFAARSRGHLVPYSEWIADLERPSLPTAEEQQATMASWRWQPVISILVAARNAPADRLRESLDSVVSQTYPHWELCIAGNDSTKRDVRQLIAEYQARDARVLVTMSDRPGSSLVSCNAAVKLATGEFIALLDHEDILAPHALFAMARALQTRPSAQVVYSDEDKLDLDGERCEPFFKPDFALDLLYSQNYIGHFALYRRDLVNAIGGFRLDAAGAQEYDLVLRCANRVDQARDIVHIPQVLYHARKLKSAATDKAQATAGAVRALRAHLAERHPGAEVSALGAGLLRTRWPIPNPEPLVTLIVATRDRRDLLETCIESIVQKTTYSNYEILIVDNQSSCPQTLEYLEALDARPTMRVLRYDHPFNYSAINNFAAREARGSILALINNDIEVIDGGWLEEMVRHASRPEIGCVGAKLYFADDTIQHAGVVLGIGGVAGHSHKYLPRDANGYFDRLRIVHNVSAVTGAVLLVRKQVFESVGGLDAERLQIAYNDVDLCLKCLEAGYRNVWTPFAELYHHESKTRGADDTPEKQARFTFERAVMQERWAALLRNDPMYNPNLSQICEDYSLNAALRPGLD